jgi:hypothetical protein
MLEIGLLQVCELFCYSLIHRDNCLHLKNAYNSLKLMRPRYSPAYSAVKQFRHIKLGRNFTIYPDHKSLTLTFAFLTKTGKASPRPALLNQLNIYIGERQYRVTCLLMY